MKTVLRTAITLAIVLWLGSLLFFPVVAAVSFSHLSDTHAAGSIVGACLRILHREGLFAGLLLLVLFVAASLLDMYPRQVLRWPTMMVLIMLALTAVSQFWIIPRMDTLRTQVADFATVPLDNPARAEFDALHVWSTRVEGAVLLLGLVAIYLTASAFIRR